MKTSIIIILTIVSISFNGIAQNNTTATCKNSEVVLEKIYCTNCAHKGKSQVETAIKKAKYAYFKFEGKEAIDVMLLVDGTAERPSYIIHIILPKSAMKSGVLESDIIDEWGRGLDNNKSVIVKFQYRLGNSNSSISQWSNWGGHNKGESEGKLILKMEDDGSICGSFTCTVYEDGSSMDKNKKSIISCKSFKATL